MISTSWPTGDSANAISDNNLDAFAGVARRMQTGYIPHYAFTMILGVFAILTWFWLQLRF